jgi:hypothetical protein
VSPQEQRSLQLAFEGLRVGMGMAVKEKGALPVFADCQKLFEEAHAEYLARHVKQGYFKLGEAKKLLKKIPTR